MAYLPGQPTGFDVFTSTTPGEARAAILQQYRYHAEKMGLLITPVDSSTAYFPQIFDAREWQEWPCDFFLTFSTDHTGGQGGVWLWVCTGDPSVSGNWKSYDTAVADGDFDGITPKPAANPIYSPTSIGISVETPFSHYIDGTWYTTTHQNIVPNALGAQTTTLSVGTGVLGLLNLAPSIPNDSIALDYDPEFSPGNGHTGYFSWFQNDKFDNGYKYMGYSLHGGGDYYHYATWGSDDIINWTKIDITELESDLVGLPQDWILPTIVHDFNLVQNGCAVAFGIDRASGAVIRDSNIYQCKINAAGNKWVSDATLLIEKGEVGEFDEKEVGYFTSIDYNGTKYLLYGATDSANNNTIGIAKLELKPHNIPMPAMAPRRDDFTTTFYHDFIETPSLPYWLFDISVGIGSLEYNANGLRLAGGSGTANAAGVKFYKGILPDDVGRLRIKLHASASTTPANQRTRVPNLGFFLNGAGTDIEPTERVMVRTFGSVEGLDRIEVVAGGTTLKNGKDTYDWGYNNQESSSFRDICNDWHADAEIVMCCAGAGDATVDYADASDAITNVLYQPGVACFTGDLQIKAIEISWGRK